MIYAVDSPLFQSFLSSGKHKPSSEEIIAALADISKKHPGSKPEQHVGGGAVLRRFLDVAAFALARPRPGTRSRAALAPAARRPGSAVAGGGIIFVRAPHSAARVERFPRAGGDAAREVSTMGSGRRELGSVVGDGPRRNRRQLNDNGAPQPPRVVTRNFCSTTRATLLPAF